MSMEQIYNKINEKLGPSPDSKQFLTLQTLGTILDPGTFFTDDPAHKSLQLQSNEARLADAAIPAAKLAFQGSKSISKEYRRALEVLLPKFDSSETLAEVRKEIQSFFSDEKEYVDPVTKQKINQTRGDRFTRLCELHAKAAEELKIKVAEEKAKAKTQEEYDKWYNTEYDVLATKIQNAKQAILTEFALGDMSKFFSILDQGASSTLEDAKNKMDHAKRSIEDAPEFYRVQLVPQSWCNNLDNTFKFTDLLDSPEYIAMDIETEQKTLDTELNNLLSQLDAVDFSEEDEAKARKAIEDAATTRQAYNDASSAILSQYMDAAKFSVKLCMKRNGKISRDGKPVDGDQKPDTEAFNKELSNVEEKMGKEKRTIQGRGCGQTI